MGEKILADITDVLRKKGKSERMEARAWSPVLSLTWRPCWGCCPHTRAACPSLEVKIYTCRAGGGTLWSCFISVSAFTCTLVGYNRSDTSELAG